MAINPETQYPGKINPSDADYPYGSARNITVPGDGTGTPWEAAIVNDVLGFQQAILTDASAVPSGTPEKVTASQYLDAFKNGFAVTIAETTQILTSSRVGIPAFLTRHYDSNLVSGSGALWVFTGNNIPGNAGTFDLANGFAYNASGDEYLIAETIIDAGMFGIRPGPDVTAAFQDLQDFGRPVRIKGGSSSYRITAPVEIKTETIAYDGRAIFDMDGLAPAGAAVTCTNESDIIGLDIDCANTVTITSAFQHTLEFTPTRTLKSDIRAFNVTNTDNTLPAYGVLYFVGGAAPNTYIDIEAKAEGHNILATANTIIGDTGGKATGVLMSVNKVGMANKVTFIEPRASNVYPDEDGDGIHIFDADSGNLSSKSSYLLVRPNVSDCSKRGIKSQGPNVVTIDAFIDVDLISGAATSANAYQSLGVNNSLINPIVVGTSVVHSDGSIVASAAGFILRNPRIKVDGGQNLIRLETGATGYTVTGVRIDNADSYASADFAMVLLEGGASGYLEIDRIINTNKTGSAVRYLSVTGDNVLKINGTGEAEHLVRYGFCTGDFIIEEAYGSTSQEIIREDGDNGTYLVKHCEGITTGASAVTTDAAMKFIGSGHLQSTTNGILYTAGVDLTGREVSGQWKLTATLGTGIGIDANSTLNGKFCDCETTGFLTHYKYNFSDKMLVQNNLGRGAGALISNTGATNAVEVNNNIIV